MEPPILYTVRTIISGQVFQWFPTCLRDRAVIIDSLVMRKCLYVAFRTGHPLSEIRSCAAAGTLSHQGIVMARDTTWIYDEPAGNLGFNLPFEIPGGIYSLEINLINREGKVWILYREL